MCTFHVHHVTSELNRISTDIELTQLMLLMSFQVNLLALCDELPILDAKEQNEVVEVLADTCVVESALSSLSHFALHVCLFDHVLVSYQPFICSLK